MLLGLLLLHSSLCLRASGQSYSIDWHKIAGGGGTSTGGVYSISGTIGQHDASTPLTGGPYSLTGGFWAIISAVQTPGLPNLTITHSGNNVIVSWPNTGSYTLQQNPNVANPSGYHERLPHYPRQRHQPHHPALPHRKSLLPPAPIP
ncbi:MAG: hypothetical protein WCS94_20090 [Verrucomicrobiota bacterium]